MVDHLARHLPLGACTVDRTNLSPAQAVARGIPRDAQEFQVLAQGVNPEGDVVMVYSYRVPTPGDPWPEEYTLGFKVLERENWIEWGDALTVLASSPTLSQVQFPIQYEVFQDGYTAVYGPLQSAQIRTVESIFSTGESVQQAVEGTGFLIFLDGKTDVCELCFFDSQDQLLESKALSKRREASDECP